MHKVDQATLGFAKAGCYVCLDASDIVDFGADIEGEGALGLCVKCLREAVVAAGYANPKDVAAQLEDQAVQLARLAEHAVTLKAQLKEARAKLKALREPVNA